MSASPGSSRASFAPPFLWPAALALLSAACATVEPAFVDRSALPSKTPASACALLTGQSISAASIGLPTSGATITSATLVAATPETIGATGVTRALPEYCRILGSIYPEDPAAPPINLQLNVPTH